MMNFDSLLRPFFRLLHERSGPPVIVVGVGLFLLFLLQSIHTPIAWLESWVEIGKVALPAAMILTGIGALMYDYLQQSRSGGLLASTAALAIPSIPISSARSKRSLVPSMHSKILA